MRNALVSIAVLVASVANAGDKPSQFTLTSDPDVQSAVHTFPAGGSPPKRLSTVELTAPRRYPSGSHLQVVLAGVVTVDGRAKVVSIERSNDTAFADGCVRAAGQWRYEPARAANGNPLAMWTKFACTLSIQ